VIIAVCMYAIPNGEKRTIRRPAVFVVTAFASTFAYVWLVIIVGFSSPDVIEPWEGVSTFAFFPILVVVAFLADKGKLSFAAAKQSTKPQLGCSATKSLGELQDHEVKLVEDNALAGRSRAQIRKGLGKIGGEKDLPASDLAVGFTTPDFFFPAGAGELVLEVQKAGLQASKYFVEVGWEDSGGRKGSTTIHKNQTQGIITIRSGSVGGERLSVSLTRAYASYTQFATTEGADTTQSNTRRKTCSIMPEFMKAQVTIADEDSKTCGVGMLRMACGVHHHQPRTDCETQCWVKVCRFEGGQGPVGCRLLTIPDTARRGHAQGSVGAHGTRGHRVGNSQLMGFSLGPVIEFSTFSPDDVFCAMCAPSTQPATTWHPLAMELAPAAGGFFTGPGIPVNYGVIADQAVQALLVADISAFDNGGGEADVPDGAVSPAPGHSRFFTCIKTVAMDVCPADAVAFQVDSTGTATANASPLAMFSAPHGTMTQSLVDVEVMEDAAYRPTELILARAVLSDVRAVVDASVPYLDMAVGATSHLAGLVPPDWERRTRAMLRAWNQVRVAHHVEHVAETAATRAARGVVSQVAAMTDDEFEQIAMVSTAVFHATSQDKEHLDHGETPTTTARGPRMAMWISAQSGQPTATTEVITRAQGRATRAITHKTRQLANNSIYMPPRPKNNTRDFLLRCPIEVAKRHRFFKVTAQPVPTAYGNEALKDIVALHFSASKVHRDHLSDNAIMGEAVSLLRDTGCNVSGLQQFHCYGFPSDESLTVSFIGRADVAPSTTFKHPSATILGAQSLKKVADTAAAMIAPSTWCPAVDSAVAPEQRATAALAATAASDYTQVLATIGAMIAQNHAAAIDAVAVEVGNACKNWAPAGPAPSAAVATAHASIKDFCDTNAAAMQVVLRVGANSLAAPTAADL
ncbi:unnamed protein product, partial [Prorocentrum cordatum]